MYKNNVEDEELISIIYVLRVYSTFTASYRNQPITCKYFK